MRLSALVPFHGVSCSCVTLSHCVRRGENIFSHNCGWLGLAGWTYDRIDEHEGRRGITMLSQSEGRELKDTM